MKSLTQTMGELLKAELYTDITLRVGPDMHLFKAHKLILMARSPVFAANLNFKQCNEETNTPLDLEGILDISVLSSEPGFRIFLEYLYTDEVSEKLSVDDALDVLDLAHFYQVEGLFYDVSKILKPKLNDDNCVDIYQRVKLYDNKDVQLSQDVFEYLVKNIAGYSSGIQFLLLDKETLRKMLVKDDLAIDETQLFKALLRWGDQSDEDNDNDIQSEEDQHNVNEAQSEEGQENVNEAQSEENQDNVNEIQSEEDGHSRKEKLESLIPLIRFPLMGPKTFTQEVIPTNLLSDSETIQMLTYFNGKQNEGMRFRTKPRNFTPVALKNLKCYTFDGPRPIWEMQTYSLELKPEIRFRTENPIKIRGLRFYSSKRASSDMILREVKYNLKYTIGIETIGSLRTIAKASSRLSDTSDQFDVLLDEPVWIAKDRYYWISTELKPIDDTLDFTPTTKGFAYGSRSSNENQEERWVTETGDVFHVVLCQPKINCRYFGSYDSIKSDIRTLNQNNRSTKKAFYGIIHSIIYT